MLALLLARALACALRNQTATSCSLIGGRSIARKGKRALAVAAAAFAAAAAAAAATATASVKPGWRQLLAAPRPPKLQLARAPVALAGVVVVVVVCIINN